MSVEKLLDKYFGGHISIGKLTIYGRNAMRWGVNCRTKKWGYICFNLPIPINSKISKFYFYLSPNATPWASTYYYGEDKREIRLSKLRKEAFGHGFNTDKNYTELRHINDKEKLSDRMIRDIQLRKLIND